MASRVHPDAGQEGAGGGDSQVLVLSGLSGATAALNGQYARCGAAGAIQSFFCKHNQMYLFKLPNGSFGIGPKLGGAAVSAFCEWGSPVAPPLWHVWEGKAKGWVTNAEVQMEMKSTSELESEIADAVAVTSRYGAITGGYRRDADRMVNDRSCFFNDEDKKWIWSAPCSCVRLRHCVTACEQHTLGIERTNKPGSSATRCRVTLST